MRHWYFWLWVKVPCQLLSREKLEVRQHFLLDCRSDCGLDETQWTNTCRSQSSTLRPWFPAEIQNWLSSEKMDFDWAVAWSRSPERSKDASWVQEWFSTGNVTHVAHILDVETLDSHCFTVLLRLLWFLTILRLHIKNILLSEVL